MGESSVSPVTNADPRESLARTRPRGSPQVFIDCPNTFTVTEAHLLEAAIGQVIVATGEAIAQAGFVTFQKGARELLWYWAAPLPTPWLLSSLVVAEQKTSTGFAAARDGLPDADRMAREIGLTIVGIGGTCGPGWGRSAVGHARPARNAEKDWADLRTLVCEQFAAPLHAGALPDVTDPNTVPRDNQVARPTPTRQFPAVLSFHRGPGHHYFEVVMRNMPACQPERIHPAKVYIIGPRRARRDSIASLRADLLARTTAYQNWSIKVRRPR